VHFGGGLPKFNQGESNRVGGLSEKEDWAIWGAKPITNHSPRKKDSKAERDGG